MGSTRPEAWRPRRIILWAKPTGLRRKGKFVVTQARICKEARKAAKAIAGTDHFVKGVNKLRFSRTWARGFCRRIDLKRRTFTTSSSLTRQEEVDGLKAFHKELLEKVRGPGYAGGGGLFPLETRVNFDEVLTPKE